MTDIPLTTTATLSHNGNEGHSKKPMFFAPGTSPEKMINASDNRVLDVAQG